MLRSAVVVAAVLLLAGCSTGGGGAPATSSAAAPTPTATGTGACALVPQTALQKAIGVDPGTGRASSGSTDAGRCTWRPPGHVVVAQATRHADQDLPASARIRPESAADVPGADRGWASAQTHTVLVVVGDRGVLLTDVSLTAADQSAYLALGEAIVQRLR